MSCDLVGGPGVAIGTRMPQCLAGLVATMRNRIRRRVRRGAHRDLDQEGPGGLTTIIRARCFAPIASVGRRGDGFRPMQIAPDATREAKAISAKDSGRRLDGGRAYRASVPRSPHQPRAGSAGAWV